MKHVQSFDNYSANEMLGEAFSNRDIEIAVENGMDAFWTSVAKKFPQVKSGDFSPEETDKLESAMKAAVSSWLKNNM